MRRAETERDGWLTAIRGHLAEIDAGNAEIIGFDYIIDDVAGIDLRGPHGLTRCYSMTGKIRVTYELTRWHIQQDHRKWLARLQADWKAYAEQPDADPVLLEQARQEGLLP